MMKIPVCALFTLLLLAPPGTHAQQASEFGDYVVHYNALNSSLITPEVARAYGIRRSDSRGLINISIIRSVPDKGLTAVRASVKTSAKNLTGQTRDIEMREITEGEDAIYYIGEFSVSNMEMFDFTVAVTPEGMDKPFKVHFRQQFYTE